MIKVFTSLALILSAQTFTCTANAEDSLFSGWDNAIPMTKDTAIENIEILASYYSFDGDEGSCGGAVLNPELVAYKRDENAQGDITHNVRIEFQMTTPVNYCENETIQNCAISGTIHNRETIELSEIICDPN